MLETVRWKANELLKFITWTYRSNLLLEWIAQMHRSNLSLNGHKPSPSQSLGPKLEHKAVWITVASICVSNRPNCPMRLVHWKLFNHWTSMRIAQPIYWDPFNENLLMKAIQWTPSKFIICSPRLSECDPNWFNCDVHLGHWNQASTALEFSSYRFTFVYLRLHLVFVNFV